MENPLFLSLSNTQVGKKKRNRREKNMIIGPKDAVRGLINEKKPWVFSSEMSMFIVGKKGAFMLTKNKGNSMYLTRQYAMGHLRIYLTKITIKFQNSALNQEVCNIWWFQRLQMSSRVHHEHQERYGGVQHEDWNVGNKKLLVFNVCYDEENDKYLKH